MGMQPTADATLMLYFKPMLRGTPSGNEADAVVNFDNYDSVALTIPVNTHLTAISAVANIIVSTHSGIIVIASDQTDSTSYLQGSGITACGTITTQIAYAN